MSVTRQHAPHLRWRVVVWLPFLSQQQNLKPPRMGDATATGGGSYAPDEGLPKTATLLPRVRAGWPPSFTDSCIRVRARTTYRHRYGRCLIAAMGQRPTAEALTREPATHTRAAARHGDECGQMGATLRMTAASNEVQYCASVGPDDRTWHANSITPALGGNGRQTVGAALRPRTVGVTEVALFPLRRSHHPVARTRRCAVLSAGIRHGVRVGQPVVGDFAQLGVHISVSTSRQTHAQRREHPSSTGRVLAWPSLEYRGRPSSAERLAQRCQAGRALNSRVYASRTSSSMRPSGIGGTASAVAG